MTKTRSRISIYVKCTKKRSITIQTCQVGISICSRTTAFLSWSNLLVLVETMIKMTITSRVHPWNQSTCRKLWAARTLNSLNPSVKEAKINRITIWHRIYYPLRLSRSSTSNEVQIAPNGSQRKPLQNQSNYLKSNRWSKIARSFSSGESKKKLISF